MNQDALQLALQQMLGKSKSPPVAACRRFLKLSDGDSPLQAYLEELLPTVVELFSAEAGMVWLRAHATQAACFALRYRMDAIHWDEKEQKKHERILQLAWQQKQPMLVEPQAKKKNAPEAARPFRLLFGPIVHMHEPLAVIEVLLEAGSELEAAQRRASLRVMQLVMDTIHTGLQKRMRLPVASIGQATQAIQQLEDEIESYQLSIQRSIEARLRQFHGWTFGSLAENQQFAKMVHKILEEHGLRVRCPECGHPSILRCSNAGNSKHGVFVFDHYLEDGRTFHGGPTTFPAITVVGKPARRARLSAS